tara:strand:- start:9557 stop:10291 length:735 start_codon:yes stop_codon:yes gene_type:complete
MNNNKTQKKYKVYALLAAHSFPKRRMESSSKRVKYFFSKTRKVDMNIKELRDYKILEDNCPREYCTYINESDKEVVLSLKGTDLVFPENGDIISCYYLVKGDEKKRNFYKQIYKKLEQIILYYSKNYKIVLTGYSLGGRYCIDLLSSKLGNALHEVHVFNPGTSIYHLYESNECLLDKIQENKKNMCKNREKLHIYLVNKDPLSVLSIGEKSKTKKVFNRKYKVSKLKGTNKKIKKNHSIMNFI